MRIALIGSGNVASVLGRQMFAAGHSIVQVFSKTLTHAHHLAAQLSAEAVDNLQSVTRDADVYLFSISDNALWQVGDWPFRTDRVVAHTAGSVPGSALSRLSEHFGVLYPLQTLRAEIPVMTGIPMLIDGSSSEALSTIREVAQSISADVRETNDEQRRKMHLAAVIVNNFPNHLFALTERFCEEQEIEFSALIPLIVEGALRLQKRSAALMQTGPAARHDESTLAAHKKELQRYPELLRFYEQFSDSIGRIEKTNPP